MRGYQAMDPRKTSNTPPEVDKNLVEDDFAPMESYTLQYNTDANTPKQTKRKAEAQLNINVLSKSSSLGKIAQLKKNPDEQSNVNEESLSKDNDIKPLNHAHSSSEIVVSSTKPLIKDLEIKDSALRLSTITQTPNDQNKFIDVLKRNYLEKLTDTSSIAMYPETIEINNGKAKVGNDELDGIFKFAIVRVNDHTIQLRLSRTLPAELMTVDDKSLDRKFKIYRKTIREQTREIEGVSTRVSLPNDFEQPSADAYQKLETSLLSTREKFITKSFPLSEVDFLPVIAVGELVFNKGDISEIIEIEGSSFNYSTSHPLDRNEAYKQFPILSNALGNIKKSVIESPTMVDSNQPIQSTAHFSVPPEQVENYKTIELTVEIDVDTYNSLEEIEATPHLSKSAQDPVNKKIYMREMFVNKSLPFYATIFVTPCPIAPGNLYYTGNLDGKPIYNPNTKISTPLNGSYNFVVVKFRARMKSTDEIKYFVQLRVRGGGSHYLTSLDTNKVIQAFHNFKTTGDLHFVHLQNNLLKEELDLKITEFLTTTKFLENIDRFGLPVTAAGTINFQKPNEDPYKAEYFISIDDQAGAFFVKKNIRSYFRSLSLFRDIRKDLFNEEGKPVRFKSYTESLKQEEDKGKKELNNSATTSETTSSSANENLQTSASSGSNEVNNKEEEKVKKELNESSIKLEPGTTPSPAQSYVSATIFGANAPSSNGMNNVPPLQSDVRNAVSNESLQTNTSSSSSNGKPPVFGRTG